MDLIISVIYSAELVNMFFMYQILQGDGERRFVSKENNTKCLKEHTSS